VVTAGRPTYDVGMRASAVPSLSDLPVAAPATRLPRPVVWLLWLLAALAGSVVLGFLAGLARPREPDPWASVPPPGPPPPGDPADAADDPADSGDPADAADPGDPASTTPSAPIRSAEDV
jgi:hypothetical protein